MAETQGMWLNARSAMTQKKGPSYLHANDGEGG